MTTVGLIGSGQVGGTVARLALAAGYDVLLSNSRGPETLAGLLEELGVGTRAGTAHDAAENADLVVVAVPLRAYRAVPADAAAGKVVIDATNYLPERDGQHPELDSGEITSSELLQQHLPSSWVVKALNNIFFEHLGALARPPGAADRSALAVAGDNEGAKAEAKAFLERVGYDTVDAGLLAQGWRYEPGTPACGTPYSASPEDWHRPKRGDAETLRTLLAAASR